MDKEGWYAFGRHQSLGLQVTSKLGVPRLCERLRVAVDPKGEIYLDNVDVNGIIPANDGPSIWILASLLNSRLLDYLFRRGSVPFRGAFYSANKQFISWLPVKHPKGGDLEAHAQRLYETSSKRNREVKGFRDWVSGAIGVPISELSGYTKLDRYAEIGVEDSLAVLKRNRNRIQADVDSRVFSERFRQECDASVERLAEFERVRRECEPRVDEAVYDLYEMTAEQRATIDAEYE